MAEFKVEHKKQQDTKGGNVRQRKGAAVLQDNRTPVQAKSYVKNEGQNFTWGKHTTIVGKKMEALLDPADPVRGESANINADQTPMMDALRKHYVINGGDLVKGHLLNDNLGGKALNNNLFPITRAANKQHLMTTENYAKTQLWTHQSPIWYTVEVSGSPNAIQHTHEFNVSLGYWDMKKNVKHAAAIQGSITSNMGDPRDYDGANGDDLETYSAGTLKSAMSKGLALHPHTALGSMNAQEQDARKKAGSITTSEHGSKGYNSY
jgi:hypothetical protein